MKLIPVLDIRQGVAVHAVRGERRHYAPVRSALCASANPVELASAYAERLRPSFLYAADLDAIESGIINQSLVQDLVRCGTPLWIDAGVRSVEHSEALISAGVARVVLATESLPDLRVLRRFVDAIGPDQLLLSIDMRNGEMLLKDSGFGATLASPETVARLGLEAGLRHFLLLDVAQTGSFSGLASWAARLLEGLRPLSTEATWSVGGGCSGVSDLEALETFGCAFVLVGSLLHQGTLLADNTRRWL